MIQLEKVRFFYVNELKIIQVELVSLLHFKRVAANVSELFCVQASNEGFLYHSDLSF